MSRHPRRRRAALVVGTALAGAGAAAAPAGAELSVSPTLDPGTVTVATPESQPALSVRQPPPAPEVSASSTPASAPPPAEAPPPQATAPSPQTTVDPQAATPSEAPPPSSTESPQSPPPVQATVTPQPVAGSSDIQSTAPSSTDQSTANPQAEASSAPVQPAAPGPTSADSPSAQADSVPSAPAGASITPPATNTSPSTGLAVQTPPPSPPIPVSSAPPAEPVLHVSDHPTGQTVGGAALQGGAPVQPAVNSSGSETHPLQGSSAQPQGTSPELQRSTGGSPVQPGSTGTQLDTPRDIPIAQPDVTPAPSPREAHSGDGGSTLCTTVSIHDEIGGGVRNCPGSHTNRITIFFGVGEGAGYSVEREPVDEPHHVQLHSEISARIGPASGGYQGNLPLTKTAQDANAGVFGAIAPVGPKIDLTGSRQGLELSGSLSGDLAAKDNAPAKSRAKPTADDGIQATVDLQIPLPNLPQPKTWSYVVYHPRGSHAIAIPLILGF
jgi:hypothetical protein